MEANDNAWEDLIRDPQTYPIDSTGNPDAVAALHSYGLELDSGMWQAQLVIPLPVVLKVSAERIH